MEPAVIAALVAGGVSLIGVIINLLIAKQARQATQDQVRLGAAIRAGEEAAKVFTAQLAAAEKFRIACWELSAALQRLEDSPDLQNKRLANAAEEFEGQYGAFINSWALAKGEIPQAQLLDLRGLRHDCKNVAQTILDYLAVLTRPHDRRGEREIRRNLDSALRELLAMLDIFYTRVNSARLQRFAEVIAVPERAGQGTHNMGPQADI